MKFSPLAIIALTAAAQQPSAATAKMHSTQLLRGSRSLNEAVSTSMDPNAGFLVDIFERHNIPSYMYNPDAAEWSNVTNVFNNKNGELEVDLMLSIQDDLKEISEQIKPPSGNPSKDQIYGQTSAAVIEMVETIDRCSDGSCDALDWVGGISDSLLKIGPMITKLNPKAGAALYAVATIGKVVSILFGGGVKEIDEEQYPPPLTIDDIEYAVENAINRVNHGYLKQELQSLENILANNINSWGEMGGVIIELIKLGILSCPDENGDVLNAQDCIANQIDSWYDQSFRDTMNDLSGANGLMNQQAVSAWQVAFGSANSYRSHYKDWENGCENGNTCQFMNGGADNMIQTTNPKANFDTCKRAVDDAKERVQWMEETYIALTGTFLRSNALIYEAITIFSEYPGCSIDDFENVLDQGLSYRANLGCKYNHVIADLMDEKDRYDSFIFDLNSVYLDDYGTVDGIVDEEQCKLEGHPFYQTCESPDERTPFGCNYGQVVAVSQPSSSFPVWSDNGFNLFDTGYASNRDGAKSRCNRILSNKWCGHEGWCPFHSSRSSFGGPANRVDGTTHTHMIESIYSYSTGRPHNNMLAPMNVPTDKRPKTICDNIIDNVPEKWRLYALPNTCPVQGDTLKCNKPFLDDELFNLY